MRIRSIRLATTVPLFLGAMLAWWFGFPIVAVFCGIAGVLLTVLQWMTVRALLHNAPVEPDRSLADRKRGHL